MHDRVVARHHGGSAAHAPGRCGRPRRSGADGQRSVRRRHDCRRPDPAPQRTGARRPAPVSGTTTAGAGEPRYAAVVLPVPVPRTYTYEIPAALAPGVVPGARVVVPLRRGATVGLVTAVDVAGPPVTATRLVAAPRPHPAPGPALLALGIRVRPYHGAPVDPAPPAPLPAALWSAG